MKRDYSREDMAWAVRLANKGHDATMIARVLRTKPSGKRGGAYSMKYQRLLDERGRDAACRYAERTARKAVEFVKANPMIQDHIGGTARLIHITRAADEQDWTDHPGARKALEAAVHIALGLPYPTVVFGLSDRQWAETAGQSRDSLRRNRDRLVKLGWITRNPDDLPGRTSRYRLDIPDPFKSPPRGDVWQEEAERLREKYGPDVLRGVPPTADPFNSHHIGDMNGEPRGPDCWAYPMALSPAHDLYRPGAYGDVGWLWAHRAVRELDRWDGHELPPFGWKFSWPPADWFAERYGTLGEGARDRRIHDDERAEFRSGRDPDDA
jgi:hypothetical protein